MAFNVGYACAPIMEEDGGGGGRGVAGKVDIALTTSRRGHSFANYSEGNQSGNKRVFPRVNAQIISN